MAELGKLGIVRTGFCAAVAGLTVGRVAVRRSAPTTRATATTTPLMASAWFSSRSQLVVYPILPVSYASCRSVESGSKGRSDRRTECRQQALGVWGLCPQRDFFWEL